MAEGLKITPAEELLQPERFRALYDETLPVVYGYLVKRCRSSEVAAELTQETFLSAVKALRDGAVVDAPTPWLVTIARRRLVDHYRRTEVRSRARPLPAGAEGDPTDTTASDVSLVTALQSLPDQYRIALFLRYVDDLTLEDVAHHLDKSTVATESLLARARRALAHEYEKLSHE